MFGVTTSGIVDPEMERISVERKVSTEPIDLTMEGFWAELGEYKVSGNSVPSSKSENKFRNDITAKSAASRRFEWYTTCL